MPGRFRGNFDYQFVRTTIYEAKLATFVMLAEKVPRL
jgi:hypothetical protein